MSTSKFTVKFSGVVFGEYTTLEEAFYAAQQLVVLTTERSFPITVSDDGRFEAYYDIRSSNFTISVSQFIRGCGCWTFQYCPHPDPDVETTEKQWHPVEYGTLYTMEDFIDCVECGIFTSDDGQGYLAQQHRYDRNAPIIPELMQRNEANGMYTHVLWFRKERKNEHVAGCDLCDYNHYGNISCACAYCACGEEPIPATVVPD